MLQRALKKLLVSVVVISKNEKFVLHLIMSSQLLIMYPYSAVSTGFIRVLYLPYSKCSEISVLHFPLGLPQSYF